MKQPILIIVTTAYSHLHSFTLQQCKLHRGHYCYTTDLLALARRVGPCTQAVPPVLPICSPPLRLATWQELLAPYPNKAFAAFLLRGIEMGFCTGIPPDFPCTSNPCNLQSALDHPAVFEAYLDREVSLGRMARLNPDQVAAVGLQVSP